MRQLVTWGLVACLMGGFMACTGAANAQNQSQPKSANPPQKKHKPSTRNPGAGKPREGSHRRSHITLTKEQHAAVMKFASQHHRELADLLQQLKNKNSPQYQQAATALHGDVERLARMKQRSPDRYQLELALWKLDSHVKLMAARLTMSKSPEIEKELRAALLKRVELRLVRLQAEQLRVQTRLKRLDAAIEELATAPERAAEMDWKKLQLSLNKSKKRKTKQRTPETQRVESQPPKTKSPSAKSPSAKSPVKAAKRSQ